MGGGSVIILGAKGMLGHALAAAFADRAPRLFDVDDFDITDRQAVERTLTAVRPGVVINAAAYTDVDGSEDHEADATAVNGTAVGYLSDVCRNLGTLLVHYSTDYVFEGDRPEGYREDDESHPINAYGRSKAAGEAALTASGASFLLIRTSWLFGAYGKNFVDTIVRKSREAPELTVVDDQYGRPTYTSDLAAHTKQLIDAGVRGIRHATNDGTTTWFDFARAVLECVGSTTPIRPISSAQLTRKAKRPAFSVLVNTKDPSLRPWQEALRDYLVRAGRI